MMKGSLVWFMVVLAFLVSAVLAYNTNIPEANGEAKGGVTLHSISRIPGSKLNVRVISLPNGRYCAVVSGVIGLSIDCFY